MPANVQTIAYVGDKPWHEQGVRLGDYEVSSQEMIAAAGLAWSVEKRPMFMTWAGKIVEVPGRRVMVRSDTGAILGDVSAGYSPLQNEQLFNFLDGLAGRQRTLYHTAGSLGEGEKVWALLKLPQTAEVVPGDAVENYLLAANAHDGTFRLRFKRTWIRVVCQNTFNLALAGSGTEYSIRHTGYLEGKMAVEDARTILGMAEKDFGEFVEVSKRLAAVPLKEGDVDALLETLMPLPRMRSPAYPRVLDEHRKVWALIEEGAGNDLAAVHGTRWAALNGVVQYADYLMGNGKRRTESLLWGNGARLKQRAVDLLTADLKGRRN